MHNCANFEQKSKGSVLDSSNSGWASPSQVGGQALSRKTSTSSDDSKACIKSIGDVMSLRPEAGACPKLTSHHVACCQVDFFVDRSFFPQPPSPLRSGESSISPQCYNNAFSLSLFLHYIKRLLSLTGK